MDKFTTIDFDTLFSQTFDKFTADLYAVFDEVIKDVPAIEVNELVDIREPIEYEQVYQLSALPPVEVISRLSSLYYEVGIVAIKRYLFLIIACQNSSNAINLPGTLKLMSRKKLFQLDFHSHSKDVVVTGIEEDEFFTDWPGKVSAEDLTFLNNTINRQLGVGEFNGLITLTAPSRLLPNSVMYDDLKFGGSCSQIGKLGEAVEFYKELNSIIDADFSRVEILRLHRDFLKEFFGYRDLTPIQRTVKMSVASQ